MADTIRPIDEHVATKEALALEALLADFKDMIADDPDLALDLAEGQTNAFEIIDALVLADGLDTELAAAAKAAAKIVAERGKRFEARIERRRVIIERFMMIMEQKKLERPAATLSLAQRPLKVEVIDESALPAEYFVEPPKPPPELDKKKLTEAVKAIMAQRDAEIEAAKREKRQPQLPALPDGVAIGNGGCSLTIRRR